MASSIGSSSLVLILKLARPTGPRHSSTVRCGSGQGPFQISALDLFSASLFSLPTSKMKLTSAFAVLPFALVASARQQANYIGCFTSSGSLENQGSYTFQTVGYCIDVCNGGDFKYAALQKNNCLCGNTVPEQADMTDDGECSSACPGFAKDNCESLLSAYRSLC